MAPPCQDNLSSLNLTSSCSLPCMPLGMGREGTAARMSSSNSSSLLLPAFLHYASWELAGRGSGVLRSSDFSGNIKRLCRPWKIKPQLLFSTVQLLSAIAVIELFDQYQDLQNVRANKNSPKQFAGKVRTGLGCSGTCSVIRAEYH